MILISCFFNLSLEKMLNGELELKLLFFFRYDWQKTVEDGDHNLYEGKGPEKNRHITPVPMTLDGEQIVIAIGLSLVK